MMPTAQRRTITRRNWVHRGSRCPGRTQPVRIDGVGGTRGGDEDHDNVLAAGIELGAGDKITVAADEIVDRTAAANNGGDGREGHGDWRGERSGKMAPSQRQHKVRNEGRGVGARGGGRR